MCVWCWLKLITNNIRAEQNNHFSCSIPSALSSRAFAQQRNRFFWMQTRVRAIHRNSDAVALVCAHSTKLRRANVQKLNYTIQHLRYYIRIVERMSIDCNQWTVIFQNGNGSCILFFFMMESLMLYGTWNSQWVRKWIKVIAFDMLTAASQMNHLFLSILSRTITFHSSPESKFRLLCPPFLPLPAATTFPYVSFTPMIGCVLCCTSVFCLSISMTKRRKQENICPAILALLCSATNSPKENQLQLPI